MMQIELQHTHPWQVSPREAVEIQRNLSSLVREEPLARPVQSIAGIDVSVRENEVQVAVVVLSLPDLEKVDQAIWNGVAPFPYVPGLLSFREVPCVLPALERLKVWPDLFMTDGQGYAHPRRFGLASHLGVLLEWPTFGVAKTRLIGTHEEPDQNRGGHVPLLDKGEIIGSVVRTRTSVKPVFVSIGHRITLGEALHMTLLSSTRYRIPEPTRLAHHLSRSKMQA